MREVRTLSVHAEQPIDFSFDALPEVEMVLRVLFELSLLFFRKFVLSMSGVSLLTCRDFIECAAAERRADPRWRPHVNLHLLGDLLKLGNDLHTGASSANDANGLVIEVNTMVPIGAVHLRTFEVVQAFDVRPPPIVQYACAIHPNVAPVIPFLFSFLIFDDSGLVSVVSEDRLDDRDEQFPNPLFFVPGSF